MTANIREKQSCPVEGCGHKSRSTETLYQHLYSRHTKRDVIQTLLKCTATLADIKERDRYRELAKR